MIAAILKAQCLSLLRGGIAGRSLSGVLGLVAAAFWYSLWTALAIGAWALAGNAESAGTLRAALPRALMFVVLYWQLAPVLTAAMGASVDIRRLRLYPIPQGKLFAIEVLLRTTTGVEMLLVMAGLLAGMSRNPQFSGATANLQRAGVFAMFAGFNLMLAAGLRSLLERLMARRFVREVLALAIVSVAVLPQFLMATQVRLRAVREFLLSAPAPVWPWSAAARLALPGTEWWDWAVLGGWTVAAWIFGRRQFAHSLAYDFQADGATVEGARRMELGGGRLAWLAAALLPDPLAAVVEKEIRSLARSPRFRTVFIMGFSFALLIWFPIAFRSGGNSYVASDFLTVVCVYSLLLLGQITYWNSFGLDRTAAQAYFVWPVSLRTVLLGKNVAAVLYILLEVTAITMVSLLARLPVTGEKIAEAFLVTPTVALYLLAAGNLSSVHMPQGIAPEKVMHGGSRGRLQGMMFLAYPAALLPVGIAYLARYAFHSQIAFFLVLAVSAAFGMAVYHVATDSAVKACLAKRESMLAELGRGEGPIAS